MRVVLDANIYVSALISTLGNPRRIIEYWERGEFDVLITQDIVNEISQVLRYPRLARQHKKDEGSIKRFVKLLTRQAIMIVVDEPLDIVQDDESDNRYIECAVVGRADYLISGDNHLLEIGEFRGTIILPPATFVTLLETGTA